MAPSSGLLCRGPGVFLESAVTGAQRCPAWVTSRAMPVSFLQCGVWSRLRAWLKLCGQMVWMSQDSLEVAWYTVGAHA